MNIKLNNKKIKHKPQEGFQKEHPKYTDRGEFKKGHIPWNKGKCIFVKKVCLFCGKEFEVRKDQIKRGRGQYCSKKCYDKAKTIYFASPGERFINQLRQFNEYREWRMKCLKRDWFRCQKCFTKNNLEVHHLKSFTEIVIEFLQKYNQFSPIEDKKILYNLAILYKPLWDINNGLTLCEIHHKSLRKII